MSELAISVENLRYSFKGQEVLKNINLEIEKDKIYGLLGKNGAGKTTLINLIANQLVAKDGTINIFGTDPREDADVLDRICIVREADAFLLDIKAKEIFLLYQRLYPYYDKELERKLVDFFNLPIKKSIKKYSRGMKSLLFNIIGICSNAEITIFDEPTLGLDAENREQFYNILLDEYSKNPRTIIISTHLIDEVEQLLEKVIIIHDGKIMIQDEVENIIEKSYYISGSKQKLEQLEGLKNRMPSQVFGQTQVYSYFGRLSRKDRDIVEQENIDIIPMGLQKAFVELTKDKVFKSKE